MGTNIIEAAVKEANTLYTTGFKGAQVKAIDVANAIERLNLCCEDAADILCALHKNLSLDAPGGIDIDDELDAIQDAFMGLYDKARLEALALNVDDDPADWEGKRA